MTTRNLRIDFADLMGRPLTGGRAYLFAVRTDTTSPQAPLYTRRDIFDPDSIQVILIGEDARVSVELVPSAHFVTPMQYILRIGESEIAFTMPDEDAVLIEIISGPPPVHPSGATFYMAASANGSLMDGALLTALQGGTSSQSREPITAPTFTGDRYLYYAQPASLPDLTSFVARPGTRNQIGFLMVQASMPTISGVVYKVWRTRTVVFDSESGRRYDVS